MGDVVRGDTCKAGHGFEPHGRVFFRVICDLGLGTTSTCGCLLGSSLPATSASTLSSTERTMQCNIEKALNHFVAENENCVLPFNLCIYMAKEEIFFLSLNKY